MEAEFDVMGHQYPQNVNVGARCARSSKEEEKECASSLKIQQIIQ